MLPLRPGLPERRTHDYKRNGTTTLFAALDVATGKITADACYPRHRHQEFLKFLKKAAAAHPHVELHVVLDNYAPHKHPEIRSWLADNPRVSLHFTPTGCSWLNMAEIFFGIITRQAIRRGTFRNVKDLTNAIGRFIDAYNQRCQPFTWTKDADELITKIKPRRRRAGSVRWCAPRSRASAWRGPRAGSLLRCAREVRSPGPCRAGCLSPRSGKAAKASAWPSAVGIRSVFPVIIAAQPSPPGEAGVLPRGQFYLHR
jgi:transposase